MNNIVMIPYRLAFSFVDSGRRAILLAEAETSLIAYQQISLGKAVRQAGDTGITKGLQYEHVIYLLAVSAPSFKTIKKAPALHSEEKSECGQELNMNCKL